MCDLIRNLEDFFYSVGHEQNLHIYVTKNSSNLKISVDPLKIPKFNKRRTVNKVVWPGKRSKYNKLRAYVYSGLE